MLGTRTITTDDWKDLVPIARGGTDEPGNLVLCCRACNAAKGDRSVYGWRMAL